MTALKKVEQETIIRFDKGSDVAFIFTYEKTWHSHFKNKLHLLPIEDNGEGGLFFEVPKTWIRKPQKTRRKGN